MVKIAVKSGRGKVEDRRQKSEEKKTFSIDLGFIYKTKGFLPEEVYLNEHFGVRIGTTIRI